MIDLECSEEEKQSIEYFWSMGLVFGPPRVRGAFGGSLAVQKYHPSTDASCFWGGLIVLCQIKTDQILFSTLSLTTQ